MEKMLEANYFRDYRHSYMILPCHATRPDKSYSSKLLTSNKFEEILRCSMRYVNGAAYFYYDISSRTTLESLYRGRQISAQQVKELFEQLCGICGRLGDYFMDETKLVLLPEHIYYDFSCGKYIGLYYPDYEENNPFEALMDYLLEHMDSRDERLADAIYQIYERTEEGGFSLFDALRFLEEREGLSSEEEKEIKELPAFAPHVEGVQTLTPSLKDEMFFGEESFCTEGKKAEPQSKKKNPFSVFLMTLSVLGIAGITWVYGAYELSDQELMTLFGCGVLMGVCFFAGFVSALKGKKEKRESASESFTQEEENISVPEPVSLAGVLCREIEPRPGMSGQRRIMNEERMLEEQENCGNTVFFDNARNTEYKLYALDRKNKRHIELIKFPYTVGKMIGCVDCVLADDSVSRIHARFEREGDKIRLIDMNSTNGTYKNGLRLQTQESVEIEPGDEIRFGNLNYCYR